MDEDAIISAIATNAVNNQKIDDEQHVLNEIFGKCLIIPPDKINAILIAFVAIIFIICSLFAFVWFLDRPI